MSNVLWPIFGVIALILLVFLALNSCVMMTKPIPNRFQLGQVTTGKQSLVAFWPHGHHHELILGVAGAEWDHPPDFAATILFRDGDHVSASLNVLSANTVSCNWLQPQDIQGFILTWPNTNEWEHSLVPGQQYVIDCTFTGNIPSSSTLWVSCLQTEIDRRKTRRNRTKP
jgi:hypothetical protein